MAEKIQCCGEFYCRPSCPFTSSEPAPIIHHTQCCGSVVWIYTDYREDGELLIPICWTCKRRVTLEGEIIE